MAEELNNPLTRTQGLLDVLERKQAMEKMAGALQSFEFLTKLIGAAGGEAKELVLARETEKSAFPLRGKVVNLAALCLRILDIIDRQKDLGRLP